MPFDPNKGTYAYIYHIWNRSITATVLVYADNILMAQKLISNSEWKHHNYKMIIKIDNLIDIVGEFEDKATI